MYQYELIYQAKDNLAELETIYIKADTQAEAMQKTATWLLNSGRLVDYIFSSMRVGA